MSKASRKGATFETQIADYISQRLGKEVIRRRLTGQNDKGDLHGLKMRGKRVTVECKNRKQMNLSQWIDEAEIERGNDDGEFGIVIHKRPGKGAKNLGENYVTMTLDTYLGMTAGAMELLED